MKISVIIPAFNEARVIAEAVKSAAGAFEVIVADGGSTDKTLEAAASIGARTISVPNGRGGQMDAGAEAASGDALLFLHADARLPEGWAASVERALSDHGAVAGAFSLSIDSGRLIFRLIEAGANFRAKRLGFIYGDQAIFARRSAFFDCGGFKKLPLMEDADCVKRLRKLGAVVVMGEHVRTSVRRWEEKGVLRSTLLNWTVLSLWAVGVSPARLRKIYYAS